MVHDVVWRGTLSLSCPTQLALALAVALALTLALTTPTGVSECGSRGICASWRR